MSNVEKVERDLEKLSPKELSLIRDFLDDLLEDNLEFTEEFDSKIRQSEQEMAAGG